MRRRAGMSLIELLVYIAIAAVLMTFVGPLVAKGVEAASLAERIMRTTARAEGALESICADIRQAESVTVVPPPAKPPDHARRLVVTAPDGAAVAYYVEPDGLARYRVPAGATVPEAGPCPEDWPRRLVAPDCVRLRAEAIEGLDRVYGIEMEFAIGRPGVLDVSPEKRRAVFMTAAQVRKEATP